MTAAFFTDCAVADDLFQVFDGAINEDALLVDARHRRHERRRPRRQDHGVVSDLFAESGAHHPLLAVDFDDAVADEKLNVVLLVPVGRGHRQLFRLAMLKILRQMNAVVSGPRFFTKRHDLILAANVVFKEPFTKAMADHAVADDHHRFLSLTDHDGSLRSMGLLRRR